MIFAVEIHVPCCGTTTPATIDEPCHAKQSSLIQTSRRR